MSPDPARRLRSLADVLVRVGLNLQPGQRLLLADPYVLHGVPPECGDLVDAIRESAAAAGGAGTGVVWADPPLLRRSLQSGDRRGFLRLVANGVRRIEDHLARGDALLFLAGGTAEFDGIDPALLGDFRALAWRETGAAIQNLVAGATNWTVVPAPTPAWADAAFTDRPADARLPALWELVFAAVRIMDAGDPVAAWQSHLAALARERDELNRRRLTTIRFLGAGTDLTLRLHPKHRWSTAALTTRGGLPFVVNLPTEEIFTLPHKDSAAGTVRVARPFEYGGATIAGAELEFAGGRVVRARAQQGEELLQRLLATDAGAARLGEAAFVPAVRDGRAAAWQSGSRCHRHVLLDENSSHHVALGDSYGFTLDSWLPFGRNRSLIHVDLPVDADVILS